MSPEALRDYGFLSGNFLENFIFSQGITLAGFGDISCGLAKELAHLPTAISLAILQPLQSAEADPAGGQAIYRHQHPEISQALEIAEKASGQNAAPGRMAGSGHSPGLQPGQQQFHCQTLSPLSAQNRRHLCRFRLDRQKWPAGQSAVWHAFKLGDRFNRCSPGGQPQPFPVQPLRQMPPLC